MEFRKGQKAYIEDESNDTWTTIKIEDIDEEEVIYLDKEGDECLEEISCLHPYSFRTETLSKIRKLERYPLFELAEENSVFVVDGIVYISGQENFSKDSLTKLLEDNPKTGKKREMQKVSPISSLDELCLDRNEKQIEDIKDWYGKRLLKYLGKGCSSRDTIQEFMFSYVFPHFKSNGVKEEKISKLLGWKVKPNQRNLDLKIKRKELKVIAGAILEDNGASPDWYPTDDIYEESSLKELRKMKLKIRRGIFKE